MGWLLQFPHGPDAPADGGYMASSSKQAVVGLMAAVIAFASAGALAQEDPYDRRYDDRQDGRYDRGYQGDYDYAKVVDVEPLTRRVRVTTPTRECWDETRTETAPYYGPSRERGGATLLGAAIGAVIGHQIGHGHGRRAATVAGAVVGGAIARDQAERRAAQNSSGNGGYASQPPRQYTVERCQTRYNEQWEERVDGYRVTYVYNGRRQVTTLPYEPGDRIRVRVDVSPAE
jgi:uncharacterized protein YcfJ